MLKELQAIQSDAIQHLNNPRDFIMDADQGKPFTENSREKIRHIGCQRFKSAMTEYKNVRKIRQAPGNKCRAITTNWDSKCKHALLDNKLSPLKDEFPVNWENSQLASQDITFFMSTFNTHDDHFVHVYLSFHNHIYDLIQQHINLSP